MAPDRVQDFILVLLLLVYVLLRVVNLELVLLSQELRVDQGDRVPCPLDLDLGDETDETLDQQVESLETPVFLFLFDSLQTRLDLLGLYLQLSQQLRQFILLICLEVVPFLDLLQTVNDEM